MTVWVRHFVKGGYDKAAHNNTKDNTTITTTTTTIKRENPVREEKRVKYPVIAFGKYGVVSMTQEQYESLRGMVDTDTLYHYVRRLENIIMGTAETGEKLYLHSAYKTIKKWIRQDLSI